MTKGNNLVENIKLIKEFFARKEDRYFEKLKNEIDWEEIIPNRKEKFMAHSSDISYSYDGNRAYYSSLFNPLVEDMMEHTNYELDTSFDLCFLNIYRDESNGIGWHSDDSELIDQGHPIATISFGAKREIWVKPKDYKGEVPKEWRFSLPSGSLFLMPSGFQYDYFNKIPKSPEKVGTRISLTFLKLNKKSKL